MRLVLALLIVLSSVSLSSRSAHAVTFIDWTDVDLANDIAQGTLGNVAVTMSGGDLVFAITGGSFQGFDNALFCPPLAAADVVEFIGTSPALFYTITFGSPILDPVIHIRSLASELTFADVKLTRLCGDGGFVVESNVVRGVCLDGVDPNDANGTIQIEGLLSTLSFSAYWGGCGSFTIDGIDLQIGVDEAVGVPLPQPNRDNSSWGELKALYR
ncbi:MAG: hypothetical protein ACKVU1_02860 [bacterium]